MSTPERRHKWERWYPDVLAVVSECRCGLTRLRCVGLVDQYRQADSSEWWTSERVPPCQPRSGNP